jgi:tetratricopeptide (TPR) repeat protein
MQKIIYAKVCLFLKKGQFLFRRKRYDEAEKAFDLAIELDDDNFLAHYSKSNSVCKLGVMLFEISK